MTISQEAKEARRKLKAAQKVVREQHGEIIGLYAMVDELRNERDQIRKVCNALYIADTASELQQAFYTYIQLPHVTGIQAPPITSIL